MYCSSYESVKVRYYCFYIKILSLLTTPTNLLETFIDLYKPPQTFIDFLQTFMEKKIPSIDLYKSSQTYIAFFYLPNSLLKLYSLSLILIHLSTNFSFLFLSLLTILYLFSIFYLNVYPGSRPKTLPTS